MFVVEGGACRYKGGTFEWECNTLLRQSFKDSLELRDLGKFIHDGGSLPAESINNILDRISSIKTVAHGYWNNDCYSWKNSRKQQEFSKHEQNYYSMLHQHSVQQMSGHGNCQHFVEDGIKEATDFLMKGLEYGIRKAFEGHWAIRNCNSRSQDRST